MPFTDAVSSVSGRNSRASNVSAMTGNSRGGDAMASAGVLSMLKTGTDTGDIGALSFNTSRLPNMPQRTHQRRQHTSRPSGGHHQYPSHHNYAPSVNSRMSSATRDWETSSNGHARRGSLTSMQTIPTFISDTQGTGASGRGRPLGLGPLPPPGRPRESRSYSLTNAQAPGHLPRNRSAHSLKSQGHEPSFYPGPPPPMSENRPPFMYPTRLKRPGYRSPSPALSDSYAQGPMHPHLQPQPLRRAHMPPMPQSSGMPPMMQPMGRPPLQTYHSDYGPEYPPEATYLSVPQQHYKSAPHNQAMGYDHQQQGFNYRPGPMRSTPSLPMPPPGQRGYQQGPAPAMMYGPPRSHQPMMQYSPPHQQNRRGPPPVPNNGPMAHHMFHNAARMARHLPQRTDTPMTEGGPPSSDPPSSGSAPPSSSPSTPQDQSTIQVIVDPAFIDPALSELPESNSDPAMAVKYMSYADGLEKVVDDSEVEVHHPSVPPSGFVQRVRAMLESRAAADAAAKKEQDRENERVQTEQHVERQDFASAPGAWQRVTVIEEFHAPVELPASPVKIAELEGSPVKVRRLTREFVKAELAMSTTGNESSLQVDESAVAVDDKPEQHEPAVTQGEEDTEAVDVGDQTIDAIEMPASPPRDVARKGSVNASIRSAPEASKVSGMDFQLHFGPSQDETTNLCETEIETKDHFALDADTITRQQGGKDNAANLWESPKSPQHPEPPVSPLLPGDDVDRDSAVSPIHTQAAGIDETLNLTPAKPASGQKAVSERPTSETTEEPQPPPTPRTPRTYSKSVHLPKPSPTLTESTNTNRLSLPIDLTQVGDTTIGSTTDAMTDVAVRFSMPQTTITVGKPQIISIHTGNTPPKEDSTSLKPAMASHERRRGGSVTFEDDVAPLRITKKAEQHRQSLSLGSITAQARPNVPASSKEVDDDRKSRESTTELRFNGINFVRNKYPSTHLPGLKEESLEDMSVAISRQPSDIANGLQFQLPARIAAVKAMQERRKQDHEEKTKRQGQRSRHHQNGRSLAEIRDLPSLNFSSMDLIDKLNDALTLQVRSSKSMDMVRRREFSSIVCPSPQRPQSTDMLRDRYMSYFSQPEEFPESEPEESPDEPEAEVEAEAEPHDAEEPDHKRSSSKATIEVDPTKRPLSPEQRLLNVAAQVNRLSIPSVNGLGDRLSELLPSLKNLHLDSIIANDKEVAHTIEDIHHLGHIGPLPRPETVLSNRTSAGFRTLAERAEEIVVNGTHDSIVPVMKPLSLDKDLPPLPASASNDKVSAVNSSDGKGSYLTGSVSAPSDLGKEPSRPVSALTRTRTPLTEEEVRQLLPPEKNPIARGSKRSLLVSSLSSRPWNLDENYPWSHNNLAIDLNVPSPAHHRDSTAIELLRERGARSLDITPTGDFTRTTGIDIGSIHTIDQDDHASITTEQATGVKKDHVRKQSKRSIFGSIKQKIGFTASHTVPEENTLTTTASLPTSPGLRSFDSDQPHASGDRYPSCALTPPATFNLDEVRSYFSDDSSERARKTPKGKRWTGLRSKSRAQDGHSRGQSFDGNLLRSHAYDAASMNEHAASAAFTYDGVGMSKTEFRIKRFGEKLRLFFAKGGELFRSFSVRSSRPKRNVGTTRDEWLSDSLYSGV